jgi:hypothetical protein
VPLNVTIAINGDPIRTLRISRLETLGAKDRVYPYLAQTGDLSVTFVHCYSDGAEECVRRALEALANERERLARDSPR